jgi:hypothetical protein
MGFLDLLKILKVLETGIAVVSVDYDGVVRVIGQVDQLAVGEGWYELIDCRGGNGQNDPRYMCIYPS